MILSFKDNPLQEMLALRYFFSSRSVCKRNTSKTSNMVVDQSRHVSSLFCMLVMITCIANFVTSQFFFFSGNYDGDAAPGACPADRINLVSGTFLAV